MAAASGPADCEHQQILPPQSEFFYTDPTGSSGRIPNTVTKAYGCFHLNTPPPVMSSSLQSRRDPFRGGAAHPTRNLGSPYWRTDNVPRAPRRGVLQLTQDEDQAITNLLKLHHQETCGGGDGDGPPICSAAPHEEVAINGASPEGSSPHLALWPGNEHALIPPWSSPDIGVGSGVWPGAREGEGTLTESEGTAVRVLLSLGDPASRDAAR